MLNNRLHSQFGMVEITLAIHS